MILVLNDVSHFNIVDEKYCNCNDYWEVDGWMDGYGWIVCVEILQACLTDMPWDIVRLGWDASMMLSLRGWLIGWTISCVDSRYDVVEMYLAIVRVMCLTLFVSLTACLGSSPVFVAFVVTLIILPRVYWGWKDQRNLVWMDVVTCTWVVLVYLVLVSCAKVLSGKGNVLASLIVVTFCCNNVKL